MAQYFDLFKKFYSSSNSNEAQSVTDSNSNINKDQNIDKSENNKDNTKYEQKNDQINKQKDLSQENSNSDHNKNNNSANKENLIKDEKKSFAQRYQKKPTFSSSNLELESDKDSNFDIKSKSSNPPKKVDPQKKMQASQIYLVKGVDRGRNAWYYVLVDRLKVKLFLKALNDDIIHLENYGKILYSAYGDEPPKEITDALKDEYGIEG